MNISMKKICRIGSSAIATIAIVLSIYGLWKYSGNLSQGIYKLWSLSLENINGLPINFWWVVILLFTIYTILRLGLNGDPDIEPKPLDVVCFIVYLVLSIISLIAIPISNMWLAMVPSWCLLLFLIFYESSLFKFCDKIKNE